MPYGCLAGLELLLLLVSWPQFGGPNRDFTVEEKGIPAAWPASGAKRLWSRPLGEGYSGIAEDHGVLYTMYRRGDQEVVLAADGATGKTSWEHAYDARQQSHQDLTAGPGPHITPLVTDGRVFTVGINALMFALDAKTGKVVWSKDLSKDFPSAT